MRSQVLFVPSAWNCLSCERELRALSSSLATEEAVQSLADLMTDIFCVGTEDPFACAEDAGLFAAQALPLLAQTLAQESRRYCVEEASC